MPGDAAQSHSLNYVIPQRRLQCTQRAAVKTDGVCKLCCILSAVILLLLAVISVFERKFCAQNAVPRVVCSRYRRRGRYRSDLAHAFCAV